MIRILFFIVSMIFDVHGMQGSELPQWIGDINQAQIKSDVETYMNHAEIAPPSPLALGSQDHTGRSYMPIDAIVNDSAHFYHISSLIEEYDFENFNQRSEEILESWDDLIRASIDRSGTIQEENNLWFMHEFIEDMRYQIKMIQDKGEDGVISDIVIHALRKAFKKCIKCIQDYSF